MNIIDNALSQVDATVSRKPTQGVVARSAILSLYGTLFFWLFAFLASGRAAAAERCVPTVVAIDTQVITLGTQNVKGPIAAGSPVLSTGQAFVFNPVFTGCPPNSVASSWLRSYNSPVGQWNGYSLYPTGVPGIGYTLDITDPIYGSDPGRKLTGDKTGTGVNINSQAIYPAGIGYRIRVYFIATANVASGTYNIPTQYLAMTRSRDSSSTSIEGSPGATSVIYLSGFKIGVQGATCDLAAGDTNRVIKLDTVKPDSFVNKAAGRTTFELTANCPSASNVTFKFTGTPSPTDAWRFKNTGTSSGVGLWLFDRIGADKTITADSSSNTRTVAVSAGKAVLPVGAAYFITSGTTATTGTLAAVVTVNITYN